ncbi:MAG: carboxypeptidase-like regulatory domain-containing protein [Acidimicrobiales bacterium]
MRVAKACLGSLLAAVLIVMWSNRGVVIDAYENEGQSGAEVQLGGVDLTFELSPIEASPYEVVAAPDTRRAAITDTFATEVAPAVEPAPPPEPGEDDSDGDGSDGDGSEAPAPTVVTQPPVTIEPPPIYGGTAQLTGFITGPEGRVPFATVRLERHTSEGMVTKDVVTDSNGRWAAARLLGGRYRVRAWAAQDDLAMPGSQVFFLDEGANRQTDLALDEVSADPRVELIEAGSIYVGLRGTVAVSLTAQRVDEDGRVVVDGLPGTVVVFEPSPGVITSPTVALTDADGVARFSVRCVDEGRPSVNVRHSADVKERPDDPDRVHSFALPACVPIPPPPPPPSTQPELDDPATGGQSTPGGESDG